MDLRLERRLLELLALGLVVSLEGHANPAGDAGPVVKVAPPSCRRWYVEYKLWVWKRPGTTRIRLDSDGRASVGEAPEVKFRATEAQLAEAGEILSAMRTAQDLWPILAQPPQRYCPDCPRSTLRVRCEGQDTFVDVAPGAKENPRANHLVGLLQSLAAHAPPPAPVLLAPTPPTSEPR